MSISGINVQVSPSLSILDGTTSKSTNRATSGTEFELWIVPTVRGNDSPISQGNIANIKKIVPQLDGSYDVNDEDIPDSTFVVVYMDISGIKPVPIGLLSLKVDETLRILELPAKSSFQDELDFGFVEFAYSEDVGDSSRSLQENASAFSTEQFLQLQESATFSNAARMVLNLLRNVNLDNSQEFYAEKIAIELNLGLLPDSLIELNNSSSLPVTQIFVSIYSHDSTTKARLYHPDGVTPVGSMDFHNYGSNGATKHGASFSLSEFKEYVRPGELWPLISESGVVLASFDISASIVMDDTGIPMFPIPFFEYITSDSTITSVIWNWQYFNLDGTSVKTIESVTLLDALIGKMECYLENSSATYMFNRTYDPAYPSAGGISGDLIQSNFDFPTLTVGNEINKIGYRFGLYSILLQ